MTRRMNPHRGGLHPSTVELESKKTPEELDAEAEAKHKPDQLPPRKRNPLRVHHHPTTVPGLLVPGAEPEDEALEEENLAEEEYAEFEELEALSQEAGEEEQSKAQADWGGDES